MPSHEEMDEISKQVEAAGCAMNAQLNSAKNTYFFFFDDKKYVINIQHAQVRIIFAKRILFLGMYLQWYRVAYTFTEATKR